MPKPFDQLITFIYSADLGRSHEFYADKLGLTMTLDQGACRIYRVSDSSSIGVCTHHEPQPQGTILTLVTDDVDGWYQELLQAGVTIEQPPQSNEQFHIYHFVAEDPDGHQVEIQRFDRSFEPDLPRDDLGWFA